MEKWVRKSDPEKSPGRINLQGRVSREMCKLLGGRLLRGTLYPADSTANMYLKLLACSIDS